MMSAIFSKKPVGKVLYANAIIVSYCQAFCCKDYFFVIIADLCQWTHFAVKRLLCRHICCYLIVAVFAMLLRHKINFRASELANHHLIAPSQKLKLDYIFKREAEIVISAGENVVSQAEINNVELLVDLQKLFSHNVEALSRIKYE